MLYSIGHAIKLQRLNRLLLTQFSFENYILSSFFHHVFFYINRIYGRGHTKYIHIHSAKSDYYIITKD